MKKIIGILLITLLLFTGCEITKEKEGLNIVTTNFPTYDLARGVIKDSDIELSMLLKPGVDAHSFEPTTKDIKTIKDADIFIYVGGESEEWIEDILDNIDKDKTKIIKLMDIVDIKKEEIIEGMESKEEEEYDEHVWTSPLNAIKIVNKIKDEVLKIDNKEIYTKNADEYIEKLTTIDNEIREVVNNAKRKVLIFGDRFPLRYFVDEYGLEYYAAFPGCSEQNEASASTISFLIKKVKEDKVPAVLKIELSSGKIANTIASETGVKVLTFNACHNQSKEDFEKGKTYIDYMNENIKVLKEVLN